jgi:hypothetical protein
MPKRLLVLNVLFLTVAGAAAAYIVHEVTAPPVRPAIPRSRPPAATTPAAAAEAPAPRPAPGSYSMVVSRNLFSPTRSEAPPAPATAAAGKPATPPVKPNLHGVVLRDGSPVAYLEDPATKRVAGYRLGDSIAGGTVQAIHADHIVLTRPEGPLDVRLHDPAKPRPAAPPPVAAAPPLQQPGTPGAQMPQQPPPPAIQPGVQPPPGFPPGRRQLPPNLLRRVPPTTTDAPQR